jgi:hypothetical protein
MTDNATRIRLVIGTLKQAEGYVQAVMHSKDKDNAEMAKALYALSYGLRVTLDILDERVERLHQKIDRIEKKIGSR